MTPVALVTGAASGIGRATAELLAARDHELVLLDRRGADLSWVPEGVAVVTGDVTNESDNRAAVAAAEDRFGRLDAVILNAGVSPRADAIQRASMAAFDESIAVNLRAVALGIQATADLLRRSGGGAIVVTASVSGLGGEPRRWHYNAAKAGVLNLVRGAAIDLALDGIRVNAVCPGPIRTGMTRHIVDGDERFEALRRMVPLQRWGEACEVAEAIAFLASPAASFITGASLPVDGGAAAGSGLMVPPLSSDPEGPA